MCDSKAGRARLQRQAARHSGLLLRTSFQVQEELFGEWQTVPYVAPVAVGGVVSSWVPAVVC